jgi:hypothetical protein
LNCAGGLNGAGDLQDEETEMKKALSSITFWLVVFVAIIVVEGISAFAQEADIAGKWQTGSVSLLLQYQNQVTGATRPGRSSLFQYKFLPNGNYEFIGMMEMNVYNCTSVYFNQINGKYTIDGSTINLSPSRDFWRSTNSCAPNSNKEVTKAPTKKSVDYRLSKDDYGRPQLCINEGNGETCFRQENE